MAVRVRYFEVPVSYEVARIERIHYCRVNLPPFAAMEPTSQLPSLVGQVGVAGWLNNVVRHPEVRPI